MGNHKWVTESSLAQRRWEMHDIGEARTRLSSWCSASLLYLETLVYHVESYAIPPETTVVISLRSFHEAQWSPWTASAAASPGNLLGMQVFQSHLGSASSKTIRGQSSVWYWCTSKVGTLTRWSVLWTLKQDCLKLNPSSTNSLSGYFLCLGFLT